jgi:hypothetical protein
LDLRQINAYKSLQKFCVASDQVETNISFPSVLSGKLNEIGLLGNVKMQNVVVLDFKRVSLEINMDLNNVLENIQCSEKMDSIEFIIEGTEANIINISKFLQKNSHLKDVHIISSKNILQAVNIDGYRNTYKSEYYLGFQKQ